MDSFKIIAITPPTFGKGEAEKINMILSANKAHFVHIRKPHSPIEEIDKFLQEIDPIFHGRLKLHDHFKLIEKYNLGGVHLNSRNPSVSYKVNEISRSIHSLDEIQFTGNLNYFFLSPIFDSISKPGYKANFDLKLISEAIKGRNAIALGGVTPDKFPYLQKIGFRGAAMVGFFFPIS